MERIVNSCILARLARSLAHRSLESMSSLPFLVAQLMPTGFALFYNSLPPCLFTLFVFETKTTLENILSLVWRVGVRFVNAIHLLEPMLLVHSFDSPFIADSA